MIILNALKFANQGRTQEIKLENLRIYLVLLKRFLQNERVDSNLTKELSKLSDYVPDLTDDAKLVAAKLFAEPQFFKDTLLDKYPKFGTIKGKLYPLITGDLDKLFEDYAKKIGYSIDTHKEVLEIVQWAKDKELLNIGIEKFILSYYWESLKELRGKDDVTSNMIADDF
jgi:hypothetical protein